MSFSMPKGAERLVADLGQTESDRLNYYSGRRHRDILYWDGFSLHMRQILTENEYLLNFLKKKAELDNSYAGGLCEIAGYVQAGATDADLTSKQRTFFDKTLGLGKKSEPSVEKAKSEKTKKKGKSDQEPPPVEEQTVLSTVKELGVLQLGLSSQVTEFANYVGDTVLKGDFQKQMALFEAQCRAILMEGQELNMHEEALETIVVEAFAAYDNSRLRIQAASVVATEVVGKGDVQGINDIWLKEAKYRLSVAAARKAADASCAGRRQLIVKCKEICASRNQLVIVACTALIREQREGWMQLPSLLDGVVASAAKADPEGEAVSALHKRVDSHVRSVLKSADADLRDQSVTTGSKREQGARLALSAQSVDETAPVPASVGPPLVSALVRLVGVVQRKQQGALLSKWQHVLVIVTIDPAFAYDAGGGKAAAGDAACVGTGYLHLIPCSKEQATQAEAQAAAIASRSSPPPPPNDDEGDPSVEGAVAARAVKAKAALSPTARLDAERALAYSSLLEAFVAPSIMPPPPKTVAAAAAADSAAAIAAVKGDEEDKDKGKGSKDTKGSGAGAGSVLAPEGAKVERKSMFGMSSSSGTTTAKLSKANFITPTGSVCLCRCISKDSSGCQCTLFTHPLHSTPSVAVCVCVSSCAGLWYKRRPRSATTRLRSSSKCQARCGGTRRSH
jgi:hypothetical protein